MSNSGIISDTEAISPPHIRQRSGPSSTRYAWGLAEWRGGCGQILIVGCHLLYHQDTESMARTRRSEERRGAIARRFSYATDFPRNDYTLPWALRSRALLLLCSPFSDNLALAAFVCPEDAIFSRWCSLFWSIAFDLSFTRSTRSEGLGSRGGRRDVATHNSRRCGQRIDICQMSIERLVRLKEQTEGH